MLGLTSEILPETYARRMFFTSRSDAELVVADFCLICAPRTVTMSQESSPPQVAKSVSLGLTKDTYRPVRKT